MGLVVGLGAGVIATVAQIRNKRRPAQSIDYMAQLGWRPVDHACECHET
jgi:hypothetical protein